MLLCCIQDNLYSTLYLVKLCCFLHARNVCVSVVFRSISLDSNDYLAYFHLALQMALLRQVCFSCVIRLKQYNVLLLLSLFNQPSLLHLVWLGVCYTPKENLWTIICLDFWRQHRLLATLISRYRKGKIIPELNEAFRDGRVLGCSGIRWTICRQIAPCSRQITTPTPHHSLSLPDVLPTMS